MHRKTGTLRTLAIAAAAALAGACSAPADAPDRGPGGTPEAAQGGRVLLIGIDGVRPDVLAETPTPNLDALAESGVLIDDARTTTPSVSGPSWSSMLTGVWPGKHGVTNNEFTGKRYEEYPGFLSRVEAVRPGLATVAMGDWTPLFHIGTGANAIGGDVDRTVVVDGYELGWAEADAVVTDSAVAALAGGDPAAMFVYLGNPDETSHEHGSIGEEYRAAIEESDRQVGRILSALRSRPGFESESWLVLVSTDHGRREDGGHGGDSPEEMTTFVLLAGTAAGNTRPEGPVHIVDIPVTALHHLGITPEEAWGLDGRSLLR